MYIVDGEEESLFTSYSFNISNAFLIAPEVIADSEGSPDVVSTTGNLQFIYVAEYICNIYSFADALLGNEDDIYPNGQSSTFVNRDAEHQLSNRNENVDVYSRTNQAPSRLAGK